MSKRLLFLFTLILSVNTYAQNESQIIKDVRVEIAGNENIGNKSRFVPDVFFRQNNQRTTAGCTCTLDDGILANPLAYHPFVLLNSTYETAYNPDGLQLYRITGGDVLVGVGVLGSGIPYSRLGTDYVVPGGTTLVRIYSNSHYRDGSYALVGNGIPPVLSTSSGSGTGGSTATLLQGDDNSGIVSIHTGTGCNPYAIVVKVSFNTDYGTNVRVSLTPYNDLAAGLYGDQQVFCISGFTDHFIINSHTTPLADNTTYEWTYTVTK